MDLKSQEYYSPEPGPRIRKLAHAYVPYQIYRDNYSPEIALQKGTLYPELYMPYRQGPRGYY